MRSLYFFYIKAPFYFIPFEPLIQFVKRFSCSFVPLQSLGFSFAKLPENFVRFVRADKKSFYAFILDFWVLGLYMNNLYNGDINVDDHTSGTDTQGKWCLQVSMPQLDNTGSSLRLVIHGVSVNSHLTVPSTLSKLCAAGLSLQLTLFFGS